MSEATLHLGNCFDLGIENNIARILLGGECAEVCKQRNKACKPHRVTLRMKKNKMRKRLENQGKKQHKDDSGRKIDTSDDGTTTIEKKGVNGQLRI